MRSYDCKGNVSDRNMRVWQVGMCGHGRLACARSYNVKRKSCNTRCPISKQRQRVLVEIPNGSSDKSEDRNSGEFTQEMRGEFSRSFVDIKLENTSRSS